MAGFCLQAKTFGFVYSLYTVQTTKFFKNLFDFNFSHLKKYEQVRLQICLESLAKKSVQQYFALTKSVCSQNNLNHQ